MRAGLPRAQPGMAIGLLGGSFDPAHGGHAHITREAMKRFGLDRVWWLVSPGNPLKREGPAALDRRLAQARAVMRHPRVEITDIEARLGTRFTAETLGRLVALYPGVRFVWLMGADNLAQFGRWQRWETIMRTVPIGVIARPGSRLTGRMSKAADRFERYRVPATAASILPQLAPPAWCFVNIPMVSDSSTAIRARGDWRR
ncbi:nicotinate-nucleotide adenylyltransferase [Frigidibacter sp. MR17.24]|uniref:nicotinate-nucleotide adenylyltransferase n=1 Tax=Frigidibacter sp. MR17.24 TaxID=3127345 RepID=UPI003012AAC7